jgi:uncharacterized protein (TIGR00725 family)
MKELRRLPIVGVMGSGTHTYDDLAVPLGRLLATLGVHLLTGGGRGVMESVTQSFVATSPRRGLAIGILPADSEDAPDRARPGYPNPHVEIAIQTHLPWSGERGTTPLSRNHINILTSSVMVVLPGGPGTATEAELAVRYQRPAIAYGVTDANSHPIPDVIPRVALLAEVERFVRGALEGAH